MAAATATTLKANGFSYVCDLMRREASIVIDPSQEYLVTGRLVPLLRQEGFDGIADLVNALQAGDAQTRMLRAKVVDALTTNETLWFRDTNLYNTLRTEHIPKLAQNRKREHALDIWCGACATGQEPYTLAMFLDREFPELNGWHINIYATDISSGALAQARAGTYNQMEMNRGLPAPYLVKYFERAGVNWKIDRGVQRYITFRQMNLASPWTAMPRFDLIFIRNVLIYFDNPTKALIMAKAARQMKPDSALFIGASESMPANPVGFRTQRNGTISWYELPAT